MRLPSKSKVGRSPPPYQIGGFQCKDTKKQLTMEKETKKNGWGGKREGSGRKPTGHGRFFGFNSTKEVESILEAVGKWKTDFINKAIVFYAKNNTNS